MAQANNKNITKKSEFDIEEDFQDKTRPNAKPSEPARTTPNQTSSNREVKKGGAVPAKKI